MTKLQQEELFKSMVIAFSEALESFEGRFGDKKLLDFFHPSAEAADRYTAEQQSADMSLAA